MKIRIILPYEDAYKAEYYATTEKEVDFKNDLESSSKVTVCFAASELKKYIKMALESADILFYNKENEDFYIKLTVLDVKCTEDDYKLVPLENGLEIIGSGRSGVLYGTYEFLKLQGYRWFAPGDKGEIVPEGLKTLILPEKEMTFSPDMKDGRGFDLEGTLPESDLLWYWMARNRFNYGVSRTDYTPLQRKLCIKFKHGGHILTGIVNPNRVLPNGKTLWEEHPEWYGKVEDRVTTPDNALHCQLCLSNDELNNFIADDIIEKLRKDWPEADKIDIWGLDIWNNICCCEKCKALGNGSDQALHMLSKIRERLNETDLKHIKIGTLAYDGTATMMPPENPIPQNLIDAGDYITLYPITRCYRHFIDTDGCQENERYYKAIEGWNAMAPAMPIMIGEYYNVSRFNELPVLFNKTIDHDIKFYYDAGARGMTYMHLPTVDFAMRSVTQLLYSEFCWNVNADKEAILADYYEKSYEKYAPQMRKVYELLEEAWRDMSHLRIWGRQDKFNSILGQMYRWDGGIPQNPIKLYDHFKDYEDVVARCKASVDMMNEAIAIIEKIRKEILYFGYNGVLATSDAVNPEQIAKDNKNNGYEYKIAEDLRFLIIGRDTMQLTGELMEYYDALYNSKPRDGILERIEKTYNALESYYVPTKIDHRTFGLYMPDGLEKTQLRSVVKRCFYMRDKI